ncbi:MAG: hypothetical protein DRR42_12280 [Gammaproteobacteria bacterium]|nr:MAG: hypothetical protein DRR42_12280 [Gammaproteobacteria bacterium]
MDKLLTDRYIRNKLSPAENIEFEQRLLESRELQNEVEEALILQKALRLEKTLINESKHGTYEVNRISPVWMKWALAASTVLAIVSISFYFVENAERKLLVDQVASLGQPRTGVVSASIKIMRSADSHIPEAIIQLPTQDSILLLEVELGTHSRAEKKLNFAFQSDNDSTILAWTGVVDEHGMSSVAIDSERVPSGLVWLVVSGKEKIALERRLLEFNRE